MTVLLIIASILNMLYLFSRTRIYQLNLATDPVSSPHAAFVFRQSPNQAPPPSQSIITTVLKGFWRALVVSFRFLLNLSPPKDRQLLNGNAAGHEKVQQLEVWTPGVLEMGLFAIYSPIHALLWMALTSANWMLMGVIMVIVSMQVRVYLSTLPIVYSSCLCLHLQMRALIRSYEALIKDRSIIAKEVMHEYDEKVSVPYTSAINVSSCSRNLFTSQFVYPRINPVRKDACVMTHQAEMVNVWEDQPRRHSRAIGI